MGGYMGFGMQKWIYSRNPSKKFYVRERIQSFTALPKYYRTFTLKPSVVHNKKSLGLLAVFIAIGFIFIINHSYINFKEYSNNHTQQITDLVNYQNETAFNFLIYCGKNRLLENKILDAYSEFKLAYAIYPKNKGIQQLLIETLAILCSDTSKYCDELDELLLKV